MSDELRREQVLGINFVNASAEEAVRAALNGGLVVAPSGTCFERFVEDADYHRAILSADIALPDSGLMVVLWRFSQGRRLHRISGLAFLKRLLEEPEIRGNILWVLPNERSLEKLRAWSAQNGFDLDIRDTYVAPIYQREVSDDALVEMARTRRPKHIIIGVGAGPQEKLGWFLRENLPGGMAIHCVGGALAFITGDQVAIPDWADRIYLGWFLRLLSQPRVFVPRLWRARILPGLIFRNGSNPPPLTSSQ